VYHRHVSEAETQSAMRFVLDCAPPEHDVDTSDNELLDIISGVALATGELTPG
jgi:hypothetical protein